MTKDSNLPTTGFCAANRRRKSKQHAWECFMRPGNALLLIAATLIPLIMFMAGQGIYSMLYFAAEDPAPWLTNLMHITNGLFYVLTLPLIGGLVYIATGLSHGEKRELKDIFYPYTSIRAYFRTWFAFFVFALAVAIVVWAVAMILNMTQGLCELAELMEDGPALFYGDVFRYCGFILIAAVAFAGLVLLGYVIPFLWLVFSHADLSYKLLLTRSLRLTKGRLWEWLMLSCSFIGWLALSVATVGILLVLFVIPYYLLTVTRYTDLVCDDASLNENNF